MQLISDRAYVLHSRHYAEDGRLIDCLLQDHGLVPVISKKLTPKKQAYIQPFVPLELNISGKGELKRLNHCEQSGRGFHFSGKKLFSALYINELLLKFLHRYEHYTSLFRLYEQSLEKLSRLDEIEAVLREFEIELLNLIGYGIDFSCDIEGNPIVADASYQLILGAGFKKSAAQKSFKGSVLFSIEAMQFEDDHARKAAKRLLRSTIDYLLEGATLKTRELFI